MASFVPPLVDLLLGVRYLTPSLCLQQLKATTYGCFCKVCNIFSYNYHCWSSPVSTTASSQGPSPLNKVFFPQTTLVPGASSLFQGERMKLPQLGWGYCKRKQLLPRETSPSYSLNYNSLLAVCISYYLNKQ